MSGLGAGVRRMRYVGRGVSFGSACAGGEDVAALLGCIPETFELDGEVCIWDIP